MKFKKSKYNFVLNHLDSIHIPKTQDLVKITGALSNFDDNTISVPYMEEERIITSIILLADLLNIMSKQIPLLFPQVDP